MLYLCRMSVTKVTNIRDLSKDELLRYFEEMGEKKFRAQQVYEWLWTKHARSFADMTNLSKELRQKLGENFSLPALSVDASQYSTDGTMQVLCYRLYGSEKEPALRRDF